MRILIRRGALLQYGFRMSSMQSMMYHRAAALCHGAKTCKYIDIYVSYEMLLYEASHSW